MQVVALSRKNVEVLTDSRKSQAGNEGGVGRIRHINDLESAKLIEEIDCVAIGLPDIGLDGSRAFGRFGTVGERN